MLHRIPILPAYPRKAHASGQARIRINGKDYYMGVHGSPESRQEYARLAQEFANAPPGAVPIALAGKPSETRVTIGKLLLLWEAAALESQTDAETIVSVLGGAKPLDRLFGKTFVTDFDAKKLRDVRKAMISGDWMTADEKKMRKARGKATAWAKSYVNKSIGKILRIFRWAEADGVIPPGKWQHLRTLERIPPSARVRTTPGRQPVDFESQVKPCLRFLPPQVSVMVQVQYLVGTRPSEVCKMRRCEVDTATHPGVWLYCPEKHKNDWRGDELVKVIGPRAQILIAPWLMAAEPEGYVFPPIRNRANADCYTSEGYYQAIRKACIRAGVKRWKPYDIRHEAADNAEAVGGIDGASAFLGHRDLETTKAYLSRQNLGKAIEVAKLIG